MFPPALSQGLEDHLVFVPQKRNDHLNISFCGTAAFLQHECSLCQGVRGHEYTLDLGMVPELREREGKKGIDVMFVRCHVCSCCERLRV